MQKPKMTYEKAVIISWRKELKNGVPSRLINLAFWTVVGGLVHYLYVPLRAFVRRIIYQIRLTLALWRASLRL